MIVHDRWYNGCWLFSNVFLPLAHLRASANLQVSKLQAMSTRHREVHCPPRCRLKAPSPSLDASPEMRSGGRVVASPHPSGTASVPPVDMLRFSCMVRNASLLQSQPSCRHSRSLFSPSSSLNGTFASCTCNRNTHCNQTHDLHILGHSSHATIPQ
jgi:hypothetical protein